MISIGDEERRYYSKMNQTMQLKPKHREMVNQYGLAFALRYEMEKVA